MGWPAQTPAIRCLLVLLALMASMNEVDSQHLAMSGSARLRRNATSPKGVFPYEFEKIAVAAQETREVKLGTPYAIRKKPVSINRRKGVHHASNKAKLSNSLARDDSIPHVPHHNERPLGSPLWPSRPFTKTELDFVGILAAIAVKLILSTALSTWFLAAGQALYSVASLTGTTAVFGMDSTIGYIYKTLPYIEALLRGEITFH